MRFCLILGCVPAVALLAAAATAPAPRTVGRVVSVVHADRRTGRLVRSVERAAAPRAESAESVESAKAWAETSAAIDQYVADTAARYEVDPLLVRSVIQVESNYDPLAVSRKGAQGLMQLMPQTARRFSVKNSFDPFENIDGGVRYLKYLLTLFGDQESPETLALAAYNAGEGAVLKHGGVPPYRETAQYVRRVAQKWGDAKQAAAPKREAPEAEIASYPPIDQFVDAGGVLHIQTRPSP
jgi:soluble lytic murein transglycosylase-like protein